MVEDIKKLSSELQIESFRDLGVLEEREIPVVNSRTMKEPAPSIAFRAQGRRRERRRTKVLASGFPRIGYIQWPH